MDIKAMNLNTTSCTESQVETAALPAPDSITSIASGEIIFDPEKLDNIAEIYTYILPKHVSGLVNSVMQAIGSGVRCSIREVRREETFSILDSNLRR